MYILKAYCVKSGYPFDFVQDEDGNPVNHVSFGWVGQDFAVVTGKSLAMRCGLKSIAEEWKQKFDHDDWVAEIVEDLPDFPRPPKPPSQLSLW